MNATLLSPDPESAGFWFSFKLLIKEMSFLTSRESKWLNISFTDIFKCVLYLVAEYLFYPAWVETIMDNSSAVLLSRGL